MKLADGIEIFNEDCFDLMRRYPDGYFDLAICDVPYGIDVGSMAYLKETRTTVVQKNGSRLNANRNKEVYTKKDWDKVVPGQDYFDELRRVSKEQIIFGIEYVEWVGVGAGRIKWNKGVADGMSFSKYEVAYCSLIDVEVELPLLWAGMMQAKSLSEPMVQQGNKRLNEKRLHPCHKPLLLYKKLLLDYSLPGQRIIDTHVGGGSIMKACYDYGCSFIGSEIDKEYYNKSVVSFRDYVSQTRLF